MPSRLNTCQDPVLAIVVSPKIALIRVDFPDPLSPEIAILSPVVTDKLIAVKIGLSKPTLPSLMETNTLPLSLAWIENVGLMISGSRKTDICSVNTCFLWLISLFLRFDVSLARPILAAEIGRAHLLT